MAETVGCARVTGTVTGEKPAETGLQFSSLSVQKENIMAARVGQQLPILLQPLITVADFVP